MLEVGLSTWEIFPHLTGLLQQWLLVAGLVVATPAAFAAWTEGGVWVDTRVSRVCLSKSFLWMKLSPARTE